MIIVDTDILIDSARCVKDAVKCLQQIEDKSSLAISAVTQMELINQFGILYLTSSAAGTKKNSSPLTSFYNALRSYT